jgi:ABC-type dipeptide/oligopeptide/nickel transport system permease subunit
MSPSETPDRLDQSSELAAFAPGVREKDIATLSQGQLIWRRFKRNRMALIGSVVLIFFYACAILGGFLAPYGLQTRFVKFIYAPPTLPRFVDENGQFHLRPFVYQLSRTVNEETLEYTYVPDTSVIYPVNFFVKGDPYKLFGFIKLERHLFGVPEVPIFLLGSDRQGRDMLSRCILGSQISLSPCWASHRGTLAGSSTTWSSVFQRCSSLSHRSPCGWRLPLSCRSPGLP